MYAANFKMLKHIPIFRVAIVSALALVICGVKVIAEESLGVTEGGKEASGGEDKTSSSDNWVESLSWNLLGYATVILPAAFIIHMLKNSNFNERSGKLFFVNCIRVLRRKSHFIIKTRLLQAI